MENNIYKHNLSAPWAFKTVAEAAKIKAQKSPLETAIITDDNYKFNYQQIWQMSLSCAQHMKSLGLKQGDVISFQLPNWYEAAVINISASLLGLIINPIVPIYRGKELIYMLKAAKSKCLSIPEVFRNYDYKKLLDEHKDELKDIKDIIVIRPEHETDTFKEILNKPSPEFEISYEPNINDRKLLLFTSGTTGRPKGVYHSHYSLLWAMQNCKEFWSLNENDTMFMPSPVTHITGYTFGLELPFTHSVPSVLMVIWKAEQAVSLINETNSTVCVGATPFLQELTEICKSDPNKFVKLRLFACGGAAVAPQIIYEANQQLGHCKAVRVYGSSETPIVTLGFTEPDDTELAANTDGQIFRYSVKIVDDKEQILSFNQEGEILVKGKSMMLGYDCDKDTESAIDDQGYFKTGDLGYKTPENAIVITGRKKDLIIRGGENISAKEIEDVLITNDNIKEVAVVAMPHQRLVETVCAYIISDIDLDLQYISELCASAELAKQKYPQHIECVKELPKTASGKVQKHILREAIKQKNIII